MDIDVMHRQVNGLVKFREQVEAFLANAGHDLKDEAGDHSLGERLTAVESKLTELEEGLTSIQQSLDALGPKLADLPAILDGVSKLADLAGQKDRLIAAADWIDQNGPQIAELLKIGDDMADPAASTSGSGGSSASGSGQATSGAGSSGGASGGNAGSGGTSADSAASAAS